MGMDGALLTPECHLASTDLICQSQVSGQCQAYACASCAVDAETLGGVVVCTTPMKTTVFGVDFYDGHIAVDAGFPVGGGVFPKAISAIRYLSAPTTPEGVQKVPAEGWFGDPVAKLLSAGDDIHATVVALRTNMGTHAFVKYTGGATTNLDDPEEMGACAREGQGLTNSSTIDPVAIGCFPTAPLSCVAVPHASHVCAAEASIKYFEASCVNEHGVFNLTDLSKVSETLANSNLPVENLTCHLYFGAARAGFLPSGNPVVAEEAEVLVWNDGGIPVNPPSTQCVVSTPAFGVDAINTANTKCRFDLKKTPATLGGSGLFSNFGSVRCSASPCEEPKCAKLDRVTLTSNFQLNIATRRSLGARSHSTPTLANGEMPAERRSLLRRELTAHSPPPAAPPSPPPSFPTLPSIEEWIDIFSALFNLPSGIVAVLNGIAAVLTVTIFEPIDEIFGVFAPLVRADGRFRLRLCALYSGFQVCGD